MPFIHILCFGNRYYADDGFGPAVYDYLKNSNVPNHWRLYDAGIMGLDSLALFENCSRVVIVDALSKHHSSLEKAWEKEQEELLHFTDLAIDDNRVHMNWNNPVHDFDLNYLLKALPHAIQSKPPQIDVVAILINNNQPFQVKLSDSVQAAVNAAGNFILRNYSSSEDNVMSQVEHSACV